MNTFSHLYSRDLSSYKLVIKIKDSSCLRNNSRHITANCKSHKVCGDRFDCYDIRAVKVKNYPYYNVNHLRLRPHRSVGIKFCAHHILNIIITLPKECKHVKQVGRVQLNRCKVEPIHICSEIRFRKHCLH